MGSLFSSLTNITTLVPRLARAITLGSAAALATAQTPGVTWKTVASAFALAFFGGFVGVGEPNEPKT